MDIPDQAAQKRLLEGLERRRSIPWRELSFNPADTNGIVVWPANKITGDKIPDRYRGETQVRKFYLGGKKGGRVVGFKKGRVMEVVWIDFKLTLYKHSKSH